MAKRQVLYVLDGVALHKHSQVPTVGSTVVYLQWLAKYLTRWLAFPSFKIMLPPLLEIFTNSDLSQGCCNYLQRCRHLLTFESTASDRVGNISAMCDTAIRFLPLYEILLRKTRA